MFKSPARQSGFALITGLILLLVISMVAISGMQSTILDYRMSSNTAYRDVAFQSSESGRIAAGAAVDQFIWYREWIDAELPTGLSYVQNFKVFDDNFAAESRLDTSSLIKDMDYDIAADDQSNMQKIEADIYVIKGDVESNGMSGLQQLSGYEGFGKGAATGGAYMMFELRSLGLASANARSISATDYRAVIR